MHRQRASETASRHESPAAEAMLWHAAGIWQRVWARRESRDQSRDALSRDLPHEGGSDETGGEQRRDDGREEWLPSIDAGHGLKHSNTPPRCVGQVPRTLRANEPAHMRIRANFL